MLACIRARIAECGITYDTLDFLAGLTRGHANKLLGPTPSKGIGKVSFGCILSALALKITIEPDPEQEAKMRARWIPRQVALPVRAEMGPIAPQIVAGDSGAPAPAYMPS